MCFQNHIYIFHLSIDPLSLGTSVSSCLSPLLVPQKYVGGSSLEYEWVRKEVGEISEEWEELGFIYSLSGMGWDGVGRLRNFQRKLGAVRFSTRAVKPRGSRAVSSGSLSLSPRVLSVPARHHGVEFPSHLSTLNFCRMLTSYIVHSSQMSGSPRAARS